MRLRFRFTKLGKVRFTSHRDVARAWERAMRRASLPIALTEGYSPRPKVHFGLALSTGYESLAEYLDADLREEDAGDVDLAALPHQLSRQLPEGIDVTAASLIDRRAPSLQQAVTSCAWAIEVPDAQVDDVRAQLERLLAAERVEVTRERKGKPVTDDLRPALLDLSVRDREGGGVVIDTELGTQPRAVRPAELLAAFDPPMPDAITVGGHVRRLHQWIIDDGAKREPLDAFLAAPSTRTGACAS